MNKTDLLFVKAVLEHVKPGDQHVAKALAFVERDLAIYEARKGQMKEHYETDYGFWDR